MPLGNRILLRQDRAERDARRQYGPVPFRLASTLVNIVRAPIRGYGPNSPVSYKLPAFCHKCGYPYPWMEDRLNTARELLDHDDKLSLDEREELWDLLQYVMSDPKSDLVPAKKKLISIKLEKAAAATKEVVVDFLAKYLAEMSKP